MQPTDDRHEQRLEPEPTWVLKAATAVILVIIAALGVLWWSGELAR